MIIAQPIILAGEFIQHPIIIVLVGVILVEFFTRCRRKEKRHDILILLAVSILAALWLITAYFVDHTQMWYHLFVHAPIVLAIIILLAHLARRHSTMVPHALFFVLVGTLTLHLGLDVVSMMIELPQIELVRTLFKISEVGILYLFVMQYLINDAEQAK